MIKRTAEWKSECIYRADTPSPALWFTLINLANETPVNSHKFLPIQNYCCSIVLSKPWVNYPVDN